ncbi:MAG: phosphohexomutase domain-containing protein [Candidatus Aminicenantales bacterium]
MLKIGISGVRGIVGTSMTPTLVMDFASAFGSFVDHRPVVVARDTRVHGPMLRAAVVSALLSSGCDVLDLGICPTPILQKAIRRRKAGGGVAITAGHNDIQWNALAFIDPDGVYLNPFQGEEVLDLYHLGDFEKAATDGLGRLSFGTAAEDIDPYFDELAAFLDADAVRSARFKVVIDACAGAGAPFLARFADALGFELIPINDEPNGFFPHDPEPRPRNAAQCVSVLKTVGADAGFLLNSDAGRVSLISGTAEALSEEFTFPLIADAVLARRPGPVITNYSTSRMIEDVARAHRCPLIRTRVGPAHIFLTLGQEEGVMAGEGSGGIAVPVFQPAFDAFLAMGIVLETMALTGQTLSALVGRLPRYHIVKEKVYCPAARIHGVIDEVAKLFRDRAIDTGDGIRAEDKHGWIQVRSSGTEPMIRVVAEDQSRERARAKVDEILEALELMIK